MTGPPASVTEAGPLRQAGRGIGRAAALIGGITVAVIIATVKGSLVAGYFMHLFAERRLIYGVLALTAVFIIAMVGLLLFSYGDQQGHHQGAFIVPQRHVPVHPAEGEHVP